jgi:hypothetical protein
LEAGVEDIIIAFMVFVVVVVPVLGFTARLALKPMVEAIIRLRESFTTGSGSGVVGHRLLQLEEEVRQLRQSLKQLKETEAFHRELLARPAEHAVNDRS